MNVKKLMTAALAFMVTLSAHLASAVDDEAATAAIPRPDACRALDALVDSKQVLFKGGDAVEGVKTAVYRIPALCTAPNGDLVAVCDARHEGGGDLNHAKPINIAVRRSSDDGKTWTDGLCIEPKGAAYSDMTILPNGDIGILYEGSGYATINFTTVPLNDIKCGLLAK